MSRLTLIGSFLCAVAATAADASLITYSSRTAFDAAVSGQTMIDFEAQNSGGTGGYNDFGSNLTIGSVSFSQSDSRLRVLGQSTFATAGLLSSFLVNDGGFYSLVVNFAGDGIYSLGMDVGQIQEYYAPVGNMTINLSSGEQIDLTGLLQLGYTTNPLRFVGFTSNTAITSISFDDPAGTTAIDNFAFSANSVPELSSQTLWAVLGLIGLLFQSRRAGLRIA